MRIYPILPLLFVVSFALTGCEHNTDLIARLNAEPLGHTNDSNIAAMVANPSDLIRGHGGGSVGSAVSVAPIERFDTDHLKPLPNPGGSSSSGGGSAASGAAAGGAAGG